MSSIHNPIFPFAFWHHDRFQLSGSWGPPVLPAKIKTYLEQGAVDEAEAARWQRSDLEHIGDRDFRVVVHDTRVSSDGAPVPPDDPGRVATKTILSPTVPPRDRENLVAVMNETPADTPEGTRAERMAWAMAFELCRRREEKHPTP